MPHDGRQDHSIKLEEALHRRRVVGFSPPSDRSGAEHRFLLMRLGAGFRDCEILAASAKAALLPPELRQRLRDRLRLEGDRLRRLARAGSLAYDLNRHIAVRAAMRWIESPS